eukprot:RCo019868
MLQFKEPIGSDCWQSTAQCEPRAGTWERLSAPTLFGRFQDIQTRNSTSREREERETETERKPCSKDTLEGVKGAADTRSRPKPQRGGFPLERVRNSPGETGIIIDHSSGCCAGHTTWPIFGGGAPTFGQPTGSRIWRKQPIKKVSPANVQQSYFGREAVAVEGQSGEGGEERGKRQRLCEWVPHTHTYTYDKRKRPGPESLQRREGTGQHQQQQRQQRISINTRRRSSTRTIGVGGGRGEAAGKRESCNIEVYERKRWALVTDGAEPCSRKHVHAQSFTQRVPQRLQLDIDVCRQELRDAHVAAQKSIQHIGNHRKGRV